MILFRHPSGLILTATIGVMTAKGWLLADKDDNLVLATDENVITDYEDRSWRGDYRRLILEDRKAVEFWRLCGHTRNMLSAMAGVACPRTRSA